MRMDENDKQRNTVFDRLKPITNEHLKPLSVYSMMVACEQKAGVHQTGKLSHPFVNFKIEVLNNCQKKRTIDDSAPCDGDETRAKKIFCPNALSPDLGCVMDFCSPSTKQDSLSSSATSKPSFLDRMQTVSRGIKENVSSQQQSQNVECGLSIDPGNIKGTVPHFLKCEEVLSDTSPDFDCDVDDILCLNPSIPSSGKALKNNPLNPSVAHRQKLERGDWHVDEEEQNKKMYLNSKDGEEDKGYFSVSYIKDLELGKNLSLSGYSPLPLLTSSPRVSTGEVKAREDESQPESSTKPDCPKQAVLSVKDVSFTNTELCPIVSGRQLESNFPEELFEGDVEEVWDIGQPIFESSVCQKISVKLDDVGQQVSGKLKEDVMEPIRECQATLGIEETTLDTSYESTLPLLKLKSVVVAPSQPTSTNKPPSRPEPNAYSSKLSQNRDRGFQSAGFLSSARSPRSVIFKTETDQEHEKRLYVHSVTRHMHERPLADPDVVTELQNLMTHLADQIPDTYGRQWQHPSDLTQRNYKKRFGKITPNMPLIKWQAKNSTTHKRFSKIPKIFERSHFP
ncbi:S100P-binding protein-like isoform X2 [Notolabrus celidotus]|nr:S100P-binding protein-like isoform X2 [Notolabrus celidotus]